MEAVAPPGKKRPFSGRIVRMSREAGAQRTDGVATTRRAVNLIRKAKDKRATTLTGGFTWAVGEVWCWNPQAEHIYFFEKMLISEFGPCFWLFTSSSECKSPLLFPSQSVVFCFDE